VRRGTAGGGGPGGAGPPRRPRPAGPSGPIAPAGPAAPVAPVAPVGPLGPCTFHTSSVSLALQVSFGPMTRSAPPGPAHARIVPTSPCASRRVPAPMTNAITAAEAAAYTIL